MNLFESFKHRCTYSGYTNLSVAMRIGETPVPIPNTMVKTYPAEDTAGATLWESRWPPNLKKEKNRLEK